MARKRHEALEPDPPSSGSPAHKIFDFSGGCNAPGQKTGTFHRKRIISGGIERQYDLLVPSGYTPGKPAPWSSISTDSPRIQKPRTGSRVCPGWLRRPDSFWPPPKDRETKESSGGMPVSAAAGGFEKRG